LNRYLLQQQGIKYENLHYKIVNLIVKYLIEFQMLDFFVMEL
jgi:sulfur relay (sulfurtransferase) DsrC/TusE family protein